MNFPQFITDNLFKKGLFEQCDAVLELKRSDQQITADAEILLEHGTVKGKLLLHEEAKALLFGALEIFTEQKKIARISDCLNELASVFQRIGDLKKARLFLNRAKKFKNAYSLIIEQIILLDEKKFEDVIFLKPNRNADTYIIACYHSNIAIAYRNLGKVEKAIENFNFAKDLFILTDHFAYLASIHNNLALCYLSENNIKLAHLNANQSIKTLKECQNYPRLASTLDTKANIHIAENDFDSALHCINESLEILKNHQNTFYILESYKTKIKILILIGNKDEAFRVYEAAHSLASKHCDQHWIEKYSNSIFDGNKIELPNKLQTQIENKIPVSKGSFTFAFPYGVSSASFGRRFCGVQINNDGLEHLGIENGFLAVVAYSQVKNGDLVAIHDKETRTTLCGFFDSGASLIGIENEDYESAMFTEEDVEIIGKIIGFCDGRKNENGKLILTLL
jgi:tetratricopeptide (TPR) repeat protein